MGEILQLLLSMLYVSQFLNNVGADRDSRHRLFEEAPLTNYCDAGSCRYRGHSTLIISQIQEDITIPGALLLVVTRDPDAPNPQPNLVRLHGNGSQEEVVRGLGYSSISSYLQLNHSAILVADSDKSSISSIDPKSKKKEVVSGIRKSYTDNQVDDTTITYSSYLGPDILTLHPLNNRKVIVSDWFRLRSIDFDNDKVTTLCERKFNKSTSFRFNEVLWDGNSYVVSSSEDIYRFDRAWKMKDYFSLSKAIPVMYEGFQLKSCSNFHTYKVSNDLLLLRYEHRSLRNNTKESIVLFSLKQKAVIMFFLPFPAGFSAYPSAVTVMSGKIYFSRNQSDYYYCNICQRVKHQTIRDYCVGIDDSKPYPIGSHYNDNGTDLICSINVTTLSEVVWVDRASTSSSSRLYPLIDSSNITRNRKIINGTFHPASTQSIPPATEEHQQKLVISLAVALPAFVCSSVLAAVVWVIHRRRSRSGLISSAKSDRRSLSVRFYNRSLPATPATGEDPGIGYCTISEGLQYPEGPEV